MSDLGSVPFDPSQSDLPPPEVMGSPSGDSGPTSGQTTSAGGDSDAFAVLAVELLSLYCAKRYASPMTDAEKAIVLAPAILVARKYLDSAVEPEWALLGAVGVVIIPRHVAAMEREAEAPQKGKPDDSPSPRNERVRQDPPSAATDSAAFGEVEKLISAGA